MNFKHLTAILTGISFMCSCANYNPQVVPYQYSDWGRHKNKEVEMFYDIKARLAAKAGLEIEEDLMDIIKEGRELRELSKDKLKEPCLKERIQKYMNEPSFNKLLLEDPEIVEYISNSCVFNYWDKSLK